MNIKSCYNCLANAWDEEGYSNWFLAMQDQGHCPELYVSVEKCGDFVFT